jgi:MYXO-CTERM domain-containing protein
MLRIATVLCSCALASVASAQLFQPTSATATSEFSASYDIGNVIDGSGLPANFTPASVHGTYNVNNHWTTAPGALNQNNAAASFFFSDPVTIGTFHMWNHLSNGVAADPGYAVTRFNLRLFDSANNELFALLNQSATPNVFIAQSFLFAPVANVSRVDFRILANNGSNNYTGLAEVAFEAVPTPGALALMGFGGLLAARRRR